MYSDFKVPVTEQENIKSKHDKHVSYVYTRRGLSDLTESAFTIDKKKCFRRVGCSHHCKCLTIYTTTSDSQCVSVGRAGSIIKLGESKITRTKAQQREEEEEEVILMSLVDMTKWEAKVCDQTGNISDDYITQNILLFYYKCYNTVMRFIFIVSLISICFDISL